MTDINVWYKELPKFTKYWLSLTVGISLLARFGILPEDWLHLDWTLVYQNFHVSSTNTFVYGHCFNLLHYFVDMETGDCRILLSSESCDRISFYAKLFLFV